METLIIIGIILMPILVYVGVIFLIPFLIITNKKRKLEKIPPHYCTCIYNDCIYRGTNRCNGCSNLIRVYVNAEDTNRIYENGNK